ncbi:MAG: cysteine--tRNA ligase [Acidobacteria bacterium]|nr:cysteine--tRNA ligase [Acidobacteriota bacterium]
MFQIFNTLTRKKEVFEPLDPSQVRMYACGLTVYDYGHIGNFRTFVAVDILRRYLRHRGYRLTHVMNITDVDDKTIEKSQQASVPLKDFTHKYIQAFLEDMRALNIETPERIPLATDHIPDMVELIRRLEQRGLTYRGNGSIYFQIKEFPSYGKLSNTDLSGMKAGARVDADNYEKLDVRDFVLWKSPKEGEPFWETAVGPGRPGWHIECSAMSMKYLGKSFDLHCGGVDLIFPHHENEIAQSEAATGKPFVKYWFHCEHLIVEGEKMSKSKGNFYTIRDLLDRGYHPLVLRYLLASAHYRKPLNFTFDGLHQADVSLERLCDFRLRLERHLPPGRSEGLQELIRASRAKFEAAMDDDLNTSGALGALFEWVREMNTVLDQGKLREDDRREALIFLDCVNAILGVFPFEAPSPDREVEILIREREDARKSREFARADQIRTELEQRGILLEDTPEGTRWKRRL